MVGVYVGGLPQAESCLDCLCSNGCKVGLPGAVELPANSDGGWLFNLQLIYVHRTAAKHVPRGSKLSRELPGRCINCEQSSLVTEIIVLIVEPSSNKDLR